MFTALYSIPKFQPASTADGKVIKISTMRKLMVKDHLLLPAIPIPTSNPTIPYSIARTTMPHNSSSATTMPRNALPANMMPNKVSCPTLMPSIVSPATIARNRVQLMEPPPSPRNGMAPPPSPFLPPIPTYPSNRVATDTKAASTVTVLLTDTKAATTATMKTLHKNRKAARYSKHILFRPRSNCSSNQTV